MPIASSIRLAAGAVALLLGAAALGCGDPLRPADVAGAYALVRVESEALPAVLYSNEYVRVRVLADTLRLNADGSGTRIGLRDVEPLQQGVAPAGETRVEGEFRFWTANGRVEVDFICPPNANCVAPPHLVARPVPGGLRVDFDLGARVPLFYARVAGAP